MSLDISKLISLSVSSIRPKLTASDAASDDKLGYSVAFSNNGLLAIGAYGVNPGTTGAVYLFSGSGKNWTQTHKLIGSNYSDDTDKDIWFGSSVAFSKDGNVLAIGAENDGNTKTGSVYLLSSSGTNWTQQAKLTASDADDNDFFGTSVAFSNGLLAIGAYGDDDNKGSVYLFSGSGTNWTQQAKLTASDADDNDYFGRSVAFSKDGNVLAIGGYYDDDNGKSNSGSVYLFSGSGTNWREIKKITAYDAADYDLFGRSIAFSKDGNVLAIGALYDDANDDGNTTGSVYLFRGSGTSWTQIKKITANDAAAGDLFGTSVAFSKDGSVLAIGSPGDDDNNKANSGSVYLYDLPLKKQKKQKSTIQLDNSQVDEYVDQKQYNNIDILGIVKTTNANGDEVNYLILDNDPNNVYGQLLKIKNDNTISRTDKIAAYVKYRDEYKNSAEIYNYIVSLLKNL